jgi:hypothetical protein
MGAACDAHPRLDRPTESDKACVASAGQVGDHGIADNGDSAARIAVEQPDKEFVTLRARLALAGFELHIVNGDGGGTAYLVQRWSMNKVLPDQAAVREFAERAGIGK